jgi:hypothetical protein
LITKWQQTIAAVAARQILPGKSEVSWVLQEYTATNLLVTEPALPACPWLKIQ